MNKTLKIWTVIGAVIAATAAAGIASATDTNATHLPAGNAQPAIPALGNAENGDGILQENPDVEYFYNLGIIEGHLTAGVALYAAGDAAMAKMHMKHPGDKVYAGLEPAMKKRGVKGFADQLAALAAAVEGRAPADAVQVKFKDVLAAIDACGTPKSAVVRANAIVKLAQAASDEYADGVIDGRVTDAPSYQDAYGYVQAAKRLLKKASGAEKTKYSEEIAAIGDQLSSLDKAWPDLSGKSRVNADSTMLAVAAARIELTASGMDR